MAKNTKNEATYILDSKKGLPNKLLQADGSITDMLGNVVVNGDKSWEAKQALPNKFLNPDGTYSTLNEILSILTELVELLIFPLANNLSKALVNLIKCSVCKEFNTASGLEIVPSNQAGPVL